MFLYKTACFENVFVVKDLYIKNMCDLQMRRPRTENEKSIIESGKSREKKWKENP